MKPLRISPRRRRVAVIGAAAAVLTALTLTSAQTAVAKPEDQFILLLTDAGLTWPSEDTQAIVAAGKGVCMDFDAGNTWAQEVQSIADNTSWSAYDADYFAVAAVNAFCPEHAGLYES